ncbi:hypothetical protein [Oceanibium sediminis]|nr:hypothetical protein [Oceanibium sediminis]
MSYDLIIADRTYSSWSLRGWLVFDAFAIRHRGRRIGNRFLTKLW